MLERLHLKNVGPASEMEMQLTDRLNVITGDNGLGKSFLLDIAWWTLSSTWAREMIVPHPPPAIPEISYRHRAKSGTVEHTSLFARRFEQWTLKMNLGILEIPALVLYAQVDGGFSVCDPARNSYSTGISSVSSSSSLSAKGPVSSRPQSYLFSPNEVWVGDENEYCEGLIRDWARWQGDGRPAYQQLMRVLEALSPSKSEPLVAGSLRRISLDDPKEYPTLKMPYGQEVAVIHASAGMLRIIALAYLLVWTWQEHLAACELLGEAPTSQIIFLIDEVEAHLHPQWQRRIIPAILDVMDAITGDHRANVQLIATTHSPLVLASMESVFDPKKDSWFDLDLAGVENTVTLQKKPYIRHGDVSNWLTSEAFDLKEARSLEAENAIIAALAVLRMPTPSDDEVQRVDELLRTSLSEIDRFWVRWSEFRESRVAAA